MGAGDNPVKRWVLLMAAALSLSACNAAVSEKPLFSARDARGAPVLKPGLWAMIQDEPCNLDRVRTEPWPQCAKPLVVDARTLTSPNDGKAPLVYVFARGEPRILQVRIEDDADADQPAYVYLGVAADPGKPVTAATAWLVMCGPPPEGQPNQLTEHPLPGMSIRDKTCYAANARAIRDAAGPSRAWGEKPLRLVWIDGMARR